MQFINLSKTISAAREAMSKEMLAAMRASSQTNIYCEDSDLFFSDERGKHKVQAFHRDDFHGLVLFSYEVELTGAVETTNIEELGTDDLLAAYAHLRYRCQQLAPLPNEWHEWAEVHHEMVQELVLAYERDQEFAVHLQENKGQGGYYETAIEWANEFQAKYGDKDWDGEFTEAIESFVAEKVKQYVKDYM